MHLYLYLIYLPMMFWKMSTSFVFPGVEFNQRRQQFREEGFQQKTRQQLTREFQMWRQHINRTQQSQHTKTNSSQYHWKLATALMVRQDKNNNTNSKQSKIKDNKNYFQLAQLCITRWWSCLLGQYRTALVGTWRYCLSSYLIFVISFTQTGFSKTKFYTKKND